MISSIDDLYDIPSLAANFFDKIISILNGGDFDDLISYFNTKISAFLSEALAVVISNAFVCIKLINCLIFPIFKYFFRVFFLVPQASIKLFS